MYIWAFFSVSQKNTSESLKMRRETETGSTFRQPLATTSERNGTRANSFWSVAGSLISYVDIYIYFSIYLESARLGSIIVFLMFINKRTTTNIQTKLSVQSESISREMFASLCFCLGCSMYRRCSQVICIEFSVPIWHLSVLLLSWPQCTIESVQ